MAAPLKLSTFAASPAFAALARSKARRENGATSREDNRTGWRNAHRIADDHAAEMFAILAPLARI